MYIATTENKIHLLDSQGAWVIVREKSLYFSRYEQWTLATTFLNSWDDRRVQAGLCHSCGKIIAMSPGDKISQEEFCSESEKPISFWLSKGEDNAILVLRDFNLNCVSACFWYVHSSNRDRKIMDEKNSGHSLPNWLKVLKPKPISISFLVCWRSSPLKRHLMLSWQTTSPLLFRTPVEINKVSIFRWDWSYI